MTAAVETAPAPAAESQIRRLVAAYAVAVMTHDTDLWLSLWAPAEDHAVDPLRLDLTWAQQVANRWDSLGTTLLHITTHLISPIDHESARGTVYCLAELDRPEKPFVQQSLAYDDSYQMSAGTWRFASRRHLLWYGREQPNPRSAAHANWPSTQTGRGVELFEELAAGAENARV
jgi:SnoaL-like domain